jgi:hypothetical protein
MHIVVLCLMCVQDVCGLNPVYRLDSLLDSLHGFPSPLQAQCFNALNAELNPTCHLLILLGDLTFMGKCIVSMSNKIQRYTVYLYLETVLHVSGGSTTQNK